MKEKEAVVAQVNPFVVEKWMIGIVIVLLFFIGMFLYFKVKNVKVRVMEIFLEYSYYSLDKESVICYGKDLKRFRNFIKRE